MAKGGKVSSKRKVKRTMTECKVSDDSADEDYVISDEENEVLEDLDEDYCSSLDGGVSEESFGSFVEEEEDEEEVKTVRKKSRSRAKKDCDGFIVDEEEEEDTEEIMQVTRAVRSKVQNGLSGREKNGVQPSRKRRIMEEDQDYDDEDDDEDEDEEFSPDEDDFSEVEEKPVVKKKKTCVKMDKRCLRKKGPVRGNKSTKAMASKNPLRKNGRKSRTLRRKVRGHDDLENDGEFMDSDLPVVTENNEKKRVRRKKRRDVVLSDSDFVSSGPSGDDYTISEEEREQVREATEFCVKTNLQSSSVATNIQVRQPKKPPKRKGKEKVEVAKRICGICLSEEDRRRVRGILDCCVHYFCFACIMEWGKVESRCPVCKQRFRTITKPAKPTTGFFFREVIQVPERDQVYQPTEEELMSYLDPFEDVLCSVCREGGEESLMLLCDMCDSPTHTYCAGLGREVPEGNWYCEGCRPIAMGSSSSQGQGWPSDQRATNNILSIRQSPLVNQGSGIDLNSVSSPFPHFSQAFFSLPSPRLPVGGFQAASPVSGAGTPTLSGRRMVNRHLQLLTGRRTERNSSDSLNNNILDSQAALGGFQAASPVSGAGTPTLSGRRMVNHHLQLLTGRRTERNSSDSLNNNIMDPQAAQGGFQAASPVSGAGTPTLLGRPMVNRHLQLLTGRRTERNSSNSLNNNILDSQAAQGGFQAASPVSGAGTPTLSGRRMVNRHLQLLTGRRTERNSSDSLNNNFLNSQAAQGRERTVQHTGADEMEASYHTCFEERLQDNPSAQLQDNGFFSSTSSPLRMLAIQNPNTTPADRSLNGTLQPELTGMNSISGHGQVSHLSSRLFIGSDAGVPPNPAVEPSDFHRAKDQLKAMVDSHLNSLSQDMDLDEASFKEMRRKSTHTVLALCELEHRGNEVVTVPLPSPACSHLELAAAGKASLLRGFCSSCFDSFVGDVVKSILDTRVPHWLSLGL